MTDYHKLARVNIIIIIMTGDLTHVMTVNLAHVMTVDLTYLMTRDFTHVMTGDLTHVMTSVQFTSLGCRKSELTRSHQSHNKSHHFVTH